MNLYLTPHPGSCSRILRSFGTLLLGAALWSHPARSHAQLYRGNYNLSSSKAVVGEYDANTGAAINNFPAFFDVIPTALALSGNDLFVVNGNPFVSEYNATTGAAINTELIDSSSSANTIAVSSNYIFVAGNGGTVAQYNATTGAALNATFIQAVSPGGLAVVPTPEPASAVLLALGSAALLGRRRRRTIS